MSASWNSSCGLSVCHADADGNGGQAVLGFRQVFVDMNDLAHDEMPDVLGYSDESGPAVLHRADGVQTDSAIRSKYDVPIPAAADAGDAAGHRYFDPTV